LRTEHGNRFHAAGPATTNARPPNFVRLKTYCGIGAGLRDLGRKPRISCILPIFTPRNGEFLGKYF